MRFQRIVWRSVLSFNNRYIHKTKQQKHLHRRQNYNSVLIFNPAEFNQIRARDQVNFNRPVSNCAATKEQSRGSGE